MPSVVKIENTLIRGGVASLPSVVKCLPTTPLRQLSIEVAPVEEEEEEEYLPMHAAHVHLARAAAPTNSTVDEKVYYCVCIECVHTRKRRPAMLTMPRTIVYT